MTTHFSNLAYAYGQPTVTGQLKQSPSDFIVTEKLSFTPSGDGEHLFLYIEKKERNTVDVCETLASHFKVHPRHVAYAGLKDRNAITTQWFSLPFPIKSIPDFNGLESDTLKVIESSRNTKKLKRGAIECNHFEITLKNLQGDIWDIKNRVKLVKQSGVPNYFGTQRFGKNENNLVNAKNLFSSKNNYSRNKKSIYLSAARSFLFNEVVSKRVKDNTWNDLLVGDVAVLNSSRSFFVVEAIDEELKTRLKQADIHPSAPLWGKGEPLSLHAAKDLEESIINSNLEFADGLVKQGMQQDRRAMRLFAKNLEFELTGDTLHLEFSLPSGTYATCVLREILKL